MIPLPIDQVLPPIVASLRAERSLVIVAPPGAGKTTRVPPAVLASGVLSPESPNLVVLQPRRVAARATAQRIAQEQGWTVGNEVGYHVRFDRKIGPRTRLRILTEGILTRQLLDDPLLDGVGGVVLDEFHERSLNSDLAIALLREVREARPDLLLIVMSATLEAEPVARYLGDCPIIRSEGRLYPVQVTHALRPSGDPLEVRAAHAALEALDGTDGDVLVFLPGAEEIRRTIEELRHLRVDAEVLPLYGALELQDQVRAIHPDPGGRRRVICATNIAETSLTIEGVTTVVDSGLERIARYDPRRGLDRLELSWISQASATQRAGRAGRVRPGRCRRLYTEKEFHAMAPFAASEIQRVDLAQTVLSLHSWGHADVGAFPWYEAPPARSIASAQGLLVMLGALDASAGRITARGRRILSVPAHPRLARVLLSSADAGRAHDGAALAALLSEKDIRLPRPQRGQLRTPQAQSRSDLLLRLEDLSVAERDQFRPYLRDAGIDPQAARQVARLREEFLRALDRSGRDKGPAGDDPLLKILLSAFPDRVCRRRTSDPASATMVGGGGVRLSPASAVHEDAFFLALDARSDARNPRAEAIVHIASGIDPAWLEELFPHLVKQEQTAAFDEATQGAIGLKRTLYQDLVLREVRTGTPDPEMAVTLLREVVAQRTDEILRDLPWLSDLLGRIAFLDAALPPRLRDGVEWALPPAGTLLEEACIGATRLSQVKANLPGVVDAHLGYTLRRLVDEHAPETIQVPTGNRIRLDWSSAQATPQPRGPVLPVRLQELFGLADTPRIAGGTVPVTLHLLGPNFRPVQVTSDLSSFWKNTYPQVRKDLRARYPKHSWPDDPLTASPQSKGGRRRG